MLAAIDQWAFQFLIVVYNLLGVQEVPRDPDPNWKIVEQWTEQADGSYRLIIESSTFFKYCRENTNNFAVFPQVHMGRQQVYLDGKIIYTNSASDKWSIANNFSEAIISCKIIEQGKLITYTVDSYLKFFATIYSYPIAVKKMPFSNFYNMSLYVIAFSICISLGVFGSILMFSLESKRDIAAYLIQDMLLALTMLSYYPGLLFSAQVSVAQALFMYSLWASFLFLIKPFIFGVRNKLFYLVIIFFTLFCTILSGNRNLLQAISTMLLVPSAIIIAYINYVINFKAIKYSKMEKILFFLLLIFSIKESYVSHVSRSGYFHLTIVVILAAVINFQRILKNIQSKKNEIDQVRNSLQAEKKVVNRISSTYAVQKEIIHDLKSPLSALNFLFKSVSPSSEVVEALSTRMLGILNRMEESGVLKSADWYSSNVLIDCIDKVILEKKYLSNLKFDIKCEDKVESVEVFFDPEDFKVIVAEIIDNSFKHNQSQSVLSFEIRIDQNSFCIRALDKNTKHDKKPGFVYGTKGLSNTGTGYGLYGIKKKIAEVGGGFSAMYESGGFLCTIHLKYRIKS